MSKDEEEKRSRGGQPRTGQPARHRLVVLLDDDEWADLQRRAGKHTMSAYVRARIFPKGKSK